MFYPDLFFAFDRRVDYVLIGALAIVERATTAIDVTVVIALENLSSLVQLARELGMTPVLPVSLETPADIEQLMQWHRQRNLQAFALRAPGVAGVTLDVFLNTPADYAQLRARATTFMAGDVPVVVASIDDLVALKQAVGRSIDLAGIEHLKRLKAI